MSEDDLPFWERDALNDLRDHWGEVYDITHHPGEAWMATRPGSAPLVTDTATELRELIRADYAERGAK